MGYWAKDGAYVYDEHDYPSDTKTSIKTNMIFNKR